MTRYRAKSLGEVYAILEDIAKPVAVFDFLSGEMGYEALCAQAVGGWFFDAVRDKHGPAVPVIALAWKGCALWYENVSDHQIELDDVDLSTLGNTRHKGEPRWAWLVLADHRERMDGIGGVIECFGPCYWGGGGVDDARLSGFVRLGNLPFEANRAGLIEQTHRRLVDSKFFFRSTGGPVVCDPYIAVFDRNEQATRQPKRNTQGWQLRWLYELAKDTGHRLVVLAGLNPRHNLPRDVIHLTPKHRDIDHLFAVARGAALFAAPACGAAEVACILGCSFLALGNLGRGHDKLLEMQTGRGFAAFGPMMRLGCPEGNKAARYIRDHF